MAGPLHAAPVLSTPDIHIFEDPTPPVEQPSRKLSDEELYITYEIERTVSEIRESRWRRIALQFPDHMLTDAPRVFESLSRKLKESRLDGGVTKKEIKSAEHASTMGTLSQSLEIIDLASHQEEEKLYILGDTSYGACCVDEIAAEHVDADVVVHYGRSCLSPTARLPVIYVFTNPPLDLQSLKETFLETYSDRSQKIILMADVPYAARIPAVRDALEAEGYTDLYATGIIHSPSSLIPNRTVPEIATEDPSLLANYALFHIADPPPSLLLTLSSRLSSIHIYPVMPINGSSSTSVLEARTSLSLRRRYALLTSLSSASVFGILINTLSVANYQHIASHLQDTIRRAGKKAYTFVVGKVNAAKIANFAEVDGWVVVGCWESSLLEDRDFWKPVVTPFELEMALIGDEERVWTGAWRADFQVLLDEKDIHGEVGKNEVAPTRSETEVVDSNGDVDTNGDTTYDQDEESAPPEFDLRTGRYVSHSRPMRSNRAVQDSTSNTPETFFSRNSKKSNALTRRGPTALASIGGEVSPGAEFLRSKRTWRGLGSDFVVEYEEGQNGAIVEEGRSGIAKGYTVGSNGSVR